MPHYLNSSRILLAVLLALCSLTQSRAQYIEYNHPELKWLSFETEHFIIYYTEGLEDVADLAAKIAEEIHDPLCDLYNYRPNGKVALIFQDTDDVANAASYFQSNKIKFWVTSMNWDFRGTHNWLRNVVTHEYTHMIQLGASRKWTRRIPAFYAQVIAYEEERRPDVLYGFPNTLVSWPLPSVTVPAWFAEGTAQYQFNGSGYDFWDSHRDMLLRQATLSNRLLSFEDMGYFGKTSIESEGVYNQGYSFTKYIADHSGGTQVLSDISRRLSSPLPVSMDDAMRKATGKRGVQWYAEWKSALERRYAAQKKLLEPHFSSADTLPTTGFVNLYPRLSPDGKKVAYISNQNRDYFGQSSLYLYDYDSGEAELLTGAANGALCWLPDGSGIIFSRRALLGDGSLVYDLQLYRFEDEKSVRLSRGLRAESADVSPDGKLLTFTINSQGRREIAIVELPDLTEKVKPFTADDLLYRHPSLPHEQYYIPRWSPDGKRIAVAYHLYEGRGIRIFEYNSELKELTLLDEFKGEGVELRDPAWDTDGENLLVAWDESGISNIYRLDLQSGIKTRLTVVLGGAMYPDIQGKRLVYSEFCSDGFRICSLDEPAPVRLPRNSLDVSLDETTPYSSTVPQTSFDLGAPTYSRESYKPAFEQIYWFPRIAFDYGTFKPGFYILLNDVLDKLTFIGGFALNQKKDYDLYALAEYRAFYPTIFAEYFNIQRRLTSHFADSSRIIGEEGDPFGGFNPLYDTFRIRYRYNLNEINVGLGFPVGKGTSIKTRAVYDQYVAHNRFDDETSVSLTYFRGWSWKLGYYTDKRRPGIDSQINPRGGYKGYVEYTRANHDFIKDIEIGGDAIGLKEIYDPNNYDLLELGLEKYFSSPIKHHTLEARVRGGFVGETVDPFFYLYAGGLPGMRGYSYYSMGGERVAVGTLTYRFPLVKRAAWNLWPLSINRIYGSVFADVGDAWNGNLEADNLKKDIGAGLRMQLHSFNLYPTAVSFDVAYGLDEFSIIEDDIQTDYVKEFRYYFTVLFDFYTPIIPPLRGEHTLGGSRAAYDY